MYELRFDGLFRGNKDFAFAGFMCIGWVLYKQGRLVAQGYGAAASGVGATSNIAEYLALIDGLQTLIDMNATQNRVLVIGDARVVINQMKGTAKVSTERVFPLYEEASDLAAQFYEINWGWIPRRKNRVADKLTRRALQELRADQTAFKSTWRQIMRDRKARRSRIHHLGGMIILRGTPAYS